ncbi:MAG: hypothetical protein GKS00_25005 [Alphaproteobacteria bacterium]|nr:hypothetical protein [Alphaproteobacteria bacterium]
MCRNEPITDYDPNVSPYLQRPLRTYEKALRDLQRTARVRKGVGETPSRDQCPGQTCDVDTHDDKE